MINEIGVLVIGIQRFTKHQEIGETLVFSVRSSHVVNPSDFMFNAYRALASIIRPASGLHDIVIIKNTD